MHIPGYAHTDTEKDEVEHRRELAQSYVRKEYIENYSKQHGYNHQIYTGKLKKLLPEEALAAMFSSMYFGGEATIDKNLMTYIVVVNIE